MMNFEVIYTIENIEETSRQFLSNFSDFKLFCFKGNLGTGKTTFITSLSRQLGSADIINSPTFSIVNEYNSEKGILYHFDLYRLKSTEEAMDIGFEEYIYSNKYCFIEWPEKVEDILPKHLVVYCQLSYFSINERKLKAWVN